MSRNRVESAGVDESLKYHVVAPVLVQQGRAWLQALEHVRHHAQILVVDRDLPRDVFGLGASVGHAHGDRLAGEPDLSKRQDRIVGDFVARELGCRPDRFDSFQITGDEHRPSCPGRFLSRTNCRVRNPASDEGNFLHARKLDIGDEIAATAEVAVVLLAREPGSDSIVGHQCALSRSAQSLRAWFADEAKSQ